VHFHFTPTRGFLAQSDRDIVLHPSGPIAQRRFFHRRLPTTGAYGCLHQRLERKRRALRLDQEKGPPTPLQRQAYHSTLIPGTRYIHTMNMKIVTKAIQPNSRRVIILSQSMLHEQKKVDPSLQPPKASNLKNAQSVKIDSCSRASVVFRGRLNTVTHHVDAAPSVRHQADLQTKAAPVLAKLRMLAAAPMAPTSYVSLTRVRIR
jgi:hypothetical protein